MTRHKTRWLRSLNVLAVAFSILSTCLIPTLAQSQNVIIKWNNAVLQGVRDSKMGPPMVARALFIVHNCIYDAWATYDRTAVGTVFGAWLVQDAIDYHPTYIDRMAQLRAAADKSAKKPDDTGATHAGNQTP